jgi:hypothetical protein
MPRINEGYPRRVWKPFVAMQFLNWYFQSGWALKLGPNVSAVLAVIATTEDQVHEPAEFYNDQLQLRAGLKNERALIRAVKAAVDAGLLHYIRGSRNRAGVFWFIEHPRHSLAKSTANQSKADVFSARSTGEIAIESASECASLLYQEQLSPPLTPEGGGGTSRWDEARDKLTAFGVKATDELIQQAQQRSESPVAFLELTEIAIATASLPANRRIINSPPAAVFQFLKNGSWPFDGVVTLEAEENRRRNRAEKERQQREPTLRQMCKRKNEIQKQAESEGWDEDKLREALKREFSLEFIASHCNVVSRPPASTGPND